MDEINTLVANATAEPIQGHLIEVFTVIGGVEPIYRTNLGFCNSPDQFETSAPPMHLKP